MHVTEKLPEVIVPVPAKVDIVDKLPTMEEIARACAEHFSFTMAQMRGRLQHAHLIRARHVAMFLCRVDARRSYPEIGRFFNRDHTSVMTADRKIFALREKGDRQLEEDLRQVRRLLELAMGLVRPESFECQDCRLLQEQNETLRQELALAKQEAAAMRVRFGCG